MNKEVVVCFILMSAVVHTKVQISKNEIVWTPLAPVSTGAHHHIELKLGA